MSCHVAIAGATGVVGQEFLRVLDQRQFPVANLRVMASPRSVGQRIPFRGEDRIEQIHDRIVYSFELGGWTQHVELVDGTRIAAHPRVQEGNGVLQTRRLGEERLPLGVELGVDPVRHDIELGGVLGGALRGAAPDGRQHEAQHDAGRQQAHEPRSTGPSTTTQP